MQPNHLIRVFFPGVSLGDTVVSISNATYPVGTLVSSLPMLNPQFYIEPDADGTPILCTVKTTYASLKGTFALSGSVVAIPMPTLEILGGHPIHRPH